MSNTLGIDIAYEALKIAGLKRSGKRFDLIGLNYSSIPKDSWSADELKNKEEIAKILKDSLRTAKPGSISGKKAMIALPEIVVFSSFFAIPPGLSKKDLQESLPFEIAEKLSLDIEDYIIDFEISNSLCQPAVESKNLKPEAKDEKEPKETKQKIEAEPKNIATGPIKQPTVLAVAAKKTLIESIIEFCELAGVELAGIDIKASAIARSLIPNPDEKMRLIIDLGANTTGITVTEGISPRLISSIPIGTKSYLQDKESVNSQFKEQISPVFDEFVHITKFFENRICPGAKITELLLIGGGSTVKTVVEVFTQETGLNTIVADPFTKINTHKFPIPWDLAHKYADCIGLAMRGIDD